ncbi:MAG: VCBS repeat-containing protein, partial [Deltaproteobacteria bacterium]|nr:VCBS repeat-containing protein [Deltaproteobacteria bacterium]
EWSNKVELADFDGDGRVDILFANGGNYSEPSEDLEPNRIFANRGDKFEEVTTLLGQGDLARVIKARDISGDGIVDILVGTTYQTQSRLYLGTGGGRFTEVTATHLPQGLASVGDLEVGDVDGDGDLDVVLADWGPGDPFTSEGAPIKLWLNSGDGHFTTGAMPAINVKWSWDLELLDLDNDYDLDILVACKACTGSKLFLGDGRGAFTDNSAKLPQFTNNYEFEPIDLDGDGFLDVVTINDGDQVSSEFDKREHVFLNDRKGGFVDATAQLWNNEANVGADDNVVTVADIDSDGDPDFLIGALADGTDRLLLNDGTGKLTLKANVFDGTPTEGTLGLALADLNGDGKLDAVQSQGELASDERVYFGSGIPKDTAAPKISLLDRVGPGFNTLRVRIHDNKTPVMPHDFTSVELRISGAASVPLTWYGGAMWRADVTLSTGSYKACAVDAAGNEACTSAVIVE